jgi:hypothetical protein
VEGSGLQGVARCRAFRVAGVRESAESVQDEEPPGVGVRVWGAGCGVWGVGAGCGVRDLRKTCAR